MIAFLSHEGLQFCLTTLLPVWLFGLATGLLCPRAASVQQSLLGAVLSGAGTVSVGGKSPLLSQVMIFINGLMLLHCIWYRFTPPGTAHDLVRAFAQRVPGLNRLVEPVYVGKSGQQADHGEDGTVHDRQHEQRNDSSGGSASWPVDESDLAFFKSRVEQDSVPLAASWETMIQKEVPGVLKYHSQRRMLNDIKKTEYMTTSVTTDSTPREVWRLLACIWCGASHAGPAAVLRTWWFQWSTSAGRSSTSSRLSCDHSLVTWLHDCTLSAAVRMRVKS